MLYHEQQLQCAQIVGDSQEGLDSLNQMATCVMKLDNPAQAAIFYKDAYKMARQLADRNIVFHQLLKVCVCGVYVCVGACVRAYVCVCTCVMLEVIITYELNFCFMF